MQWLALNNLFFVLIIPAILILYLLKRKYEKREISSILLWNKMLRDLEANRPWQKLQRNLLLLLQLLVAIFIIIALLKPALPTSGAIAEHTVIVVDTSLSMLAMENDNSRLGIAKAQITEIINDLGSNQAITLIEAGINPTILLSKSKEKSALLSKVKLIEGRVGSINDIAAYSLAKSIAIAESNSGIMWFGDGANNRINNLKDILPNKIAFKHFQVGKAWDNISIGAFITQDTGNEINGLVRVDNFGLQTKSVRLIINNIDNKIIDSFSFSVKGEGSYTIELEQLPNSQAFQALLEVEKDSLAEDNTLWSVPFKNEDVRISLVSATGNHFISRAIQAGNNIQLDKLTEYIAVNNQLGEIIIFDELVPEELPMANFLLIAPNSTTNWFSFTGEDTTKSRLAVINPNHPLLNHVDLEQVHIAKLKTFDKIAGLQSIIKAGDEDVLAAGEVDGRRVVIIAFNIYQSDLALRPAFPILIQNIISWLSEDETVFIGSAIPGESINIPLTVGSSKREIITPNGEKLLITDGGTISTQVMPEELGLFQLNEFKNEQQLTRYFTVHASEKEVNIKPEAIYINSSSINEDGNNDLGEKFSGLKILSYLFALIALLIAFMEWVVYQRGY